MNDLEDLKIDEIAFVDKGAGKGVRVQLFKRHNQNKEGIKKMKSLGDLLAEMSEEDAALVLQAIEEAKNVGEGEEEADKAYEVVGGNEGDESKTKPGKLDYEKEDEDEEEVAKRIAKRFNVLKSENESLQKRLEKMEQDREREAFAKRAEMFQHVPTLSTEELGEFLMLVNKRFPGDMAEKTEKMIKAVESICSETSIINTFGKSGAGGKLNGSAMATAEAMAKQLQDKDPALTKAAALNRVWEDNNDLRNQYRKERRGN